MSNSHYKKLVVSRVGTFVQESKIADKFRHMGLRGEVRESGLGKLIKDLLPATWEIGSGIIIDENDNDSSQMDIVIFYKEALPILFYTASKTAIFPIESCSVVIEVKTTSKAIELRKTVRSFNELKLLIPQHEKIVNPTFSLRPIRVYLALDSNLSKKDDFESYKEIDENYDTDPAIEIMCIIGKGLWYFQEFQPDPEDEHFPRPKIWERDKQKDEKGIWRFIPSDQEYTELVYLLCIITNRSIVPFTHGDLDMIDYLFSFEEIVQFSIKGLERSGYFNANSTKG